MATYWLSFRIADHGNYAATYEARYQKLIDAVKGLVGTSNKWWFETTSFYVFDSSSDIDTVATKIKAAISQAADLAVIGMPDFKSARVVGMLGDNDLSNLIPFMKKV